MIDTNIHFINRLLIVGAFLLLMWLIMNFVINKIKSGGFTVPKALSQVNFLAKLQNKAKNSNLYNVDIIQRKVFPDGSELLILDINDRHLLLSKTVHSGITYISDLTPPPPKA